MESDPLAQVEAEWQAVRRVEGAHSVFHMNPSPASADALTAAVAAWKALREGAAK